MEVYQGKSILKGIAIGKLLYHQKEEKLVERYKPESPQAEWERLLAARDITLGQLQGLYEKACREVGKVHAAVFEVHMMMLDEQDDYMDSLSNNSVSLRAKPLRASAVE
ncbi:MAG: hypothetical protein IKC75_06700 [Clostridia bacterium]|nr:hypothetical protein [Clostridia bacterium]